MINLHAAAMDESGVVADELVRVEARRAAVPQLWAEAGVRLGSMFTAFRYVETAANLSTTEKLEPAGMIPELNYCAASLGKANNDPASPSHIPQFSSAHNDGRRWYR